MNGSDTHADSRSVPVLIEVCVGSLEGAVTSFESGADRIELNLALELDGLSPSPGLLKSVVEFCQIPIITMVRPRAGNFCYSDSEWLTMVRDADWMLEQGAAGLAFGVLGKDNRIHESRCRQIRQLAKGKELVFHKAFDEVPNPMEGLQVLQELGIDRIMTSGQAASAEEGADVIGRLQQSAGAGIEILPAGGITSVNARRLVDQTGCRQIHGSFSRENSQRLAAELQRLRKELTC